MKNKINNFSSNFLWIVLLGISISSTSNAQQQEFKVFIRWNQAGYLPNDSKKILLISNEDVPLKYQLINNSGKGIHKGKAVKNTLRNWGDFPYTSTVDLTEIREEGNYELRILYKGSTVSLCNIPIGYYETYQEDLLGFMRQQRCGYNPFTDKFCHRQDGKSFFGPVPDSTFIDVSGGWHDAGDQLKYLITSSNATARMLLAYELEPDKFDDQVDAQGKPGSNDLPDVLDEARWGLDWIHKMHPAPDQLLHQVADDRDHTGWNWPHEDRSDYGWGRNSYRAAYFATGEPQGLGKYKSEATGLANLAGRSAAAMAMGARLMKMDKEYANRCTKDAVELYKLGKAMEGYQQGNSYGAPYRYTEETWADDMEWAAVELYKLTGEEKYLEDAKHYAELINTTGWMMLDTAAHYQYYPFMNVGHFALYPLVDNSFKEKLAGYYRAGIERCKKRAANNPYQVGVIFIWCSNNLLTNLITQILLYEEMTGDMQYHEFMLANRDWLLGRNPWGTSMFTTLPLDCEYPVDVHTSMWAMSQEEIPGGLIDGPMWKTIHDKQLGLVLSEEDEFAQFQNNYIIYHDDIGDYATNEPTMDGTADAIYMMAHFSK